MGVVHGYELNFLFGEPFNTVRYKYTPEERELSSRFMRYWANFARSGDPNRNPDSSYVPEVWPPFTPEKMEYVNLTVESDYLHGAKRVGHAPRQRQCNFWKNVIPSLLSVSGKQIIIIFSNGPFFYRILVNFFQPILASRFFAGSNKWIDGRMTTLRTGSSTLSNTKNIRPTGI